MKFRIYILLSAAILWFVFASIFLYRSTWNLDQAKYHKGALIEFGIKYPSNSNQQSIFAFNLEGLNETMAIHRRRVYDYDSFINYLKIGDTVQLYYDDWKHVKGNVNMQVVHMENNGHLLVDYKNRKRKDLMIAIILYSISSFFIGFTWLMRQKQLRKKIDFNFYRLGLGLS